ncbi:MAG: lysylphosphatidylglycerol synthase transmembrane domain-containing protein [Desulfobacterales bacterium]|jgi:hypothetical protein
MTARPHLHLIIGILVGAVFVYLAFRSVDIGQMLGALADANYWYVLLAVLVNMFSHYLRALRWQYFLAPVKIVNSGTLFSALIIGYAANTFVPAHLGEFLRAFVLGKKQSISASSSFASIVIERIVDVFSLILLMVLVVFIHPFPRWVVQSGYIMLAAAVVAFILLIGFKRFEAKSTLMIQFLLKPLPEKIGHKLGSMIFNFLTGVMPLKSSWHYFHVIVLSVAIWFCYALCYYFCMSAFEFSTVYQLPWYASLVVLVITTISIVVPSSPGYVGTYHFLCQVSLVMFGVSETEALSFATIAHAVILLPVTFTGLILANYEGVAIYRTAAQKIKA